jgi:Radical SAM superfamily
VIAAPLALALVTTRRCTAACDHCCFGCSPRAQDAIPIPRLHALIDEAVRVPSIRQIGFTGGECFLLRRHLVDLVARAHRHGFATRAISNGYWAVGEAAARDRLLPLRAAGLDQLMLSTGSFHQRFVPVERVEIAARTAALLGIGTRIAVEACDQSTFDAAGLRASLAELVHDGRVSIGEEPWIPDAGGRGTTELSHATASPEQAARALGPCTQVLNVLTVTPRMELTACCGFPNEELPQLAIGSVAERPLDVVLRESRTMLLPMWLRCDGPSGIAEFVARHDADYHVPRFASICHACVSIQRDPRVNAVIVRHAAEIVAHVARAWGTPTTPSPSPPTSSRIVA